MSDGPTRSREPHNGAPARMETVAAGENDIPIARRAIVDHLRRSGCDNIHDTALVVSELVTNAVLHAGGADRIIVECDSTTILITVHDRSPEPPRRRHHAAIGGRGLRIVEQLATRWGTTPHPHGKDVWAVLPR